jgi:TetR/AcrR family transcriptional repressor of nem operon
MPRKKTFTVEFALDNATELFRLHGYHNTTMEALADRLGLSRSSIYVTFGTKHDLFVQTVRHYGPACRVPGLCELHDAASPRAALLQVFELAIADEGELVSCLLINTSLELPHRSPEITAILQAAFGDLQTRFRKAIERARSANEIADSVDPVQTARALLGLYLGLHVLVRFGDSAKLAQRAVVLQVQGLLSA